MIFKNEIEKISSREDLVAFVNCLSKEFKRNPKSWENSDLGDFLEALAAWTEDMDGYYLNANKPVPQVPDWQVIAEMLVAATMYE